MPSLMAQPVITNKIFQFVEWKLNNGLKQASLMFLSEKNYKKINADNSFIPNGTDIIYNHTNILLMGIFDIYF